MADSWTKSSTPIMNCLVLDRIFGRRTFMTSVILTVDDHPDTPGRTGSTTSERNRTGKVEQVLGIVDGKLNIMRKTYGATGDST
jgi:hypothetical protein